GGTVADLEWRIKQDRDERAQKAEAAFDSSQKSPTDYRVRDEAMEAAYNDASRRWRAAHAADGIGVFGTFVDYELTQMNRAVRMARAGNFVGPDGAADSLVHFFVWGPLLAALHHQIYFVAFGLWFLTVWSIFGGAIARIAAVHVARDEK